MNLLPVWKNLALHTKLSLIFTVFVFISVPVTVLSVNSIRDSRSKATCVGDCYYPDPVVSWSKQPYYQIETCLNTTQRGTPTFCSKRTQSGGTNISLNFATGFTTYYWVDALFYSTYPNIQWYTYSSGQMSCGTATAGSLCSRTISWPAPVQTAQATNVGDATHNPCGAAGTVPTCSASKTVTYPGNTVQFVDFLPNYNFDVYVFIQGHLFNIIQNQNSGAAATFTKATLTLPAYGATGIANNPTFRWSVVPGATKFAIWVAESNNFSTGPYWANNVASSTCTSDCSMVWGSGGWTSQNGAPAAPTNLVAGKTYYWLVWSCLSTTCPFTSISQMGTFTVAATTQAPPTLLYPKDGQTGADNNPNFQWTNSPGASGYYVVLSDQSDILTFQHYYRKLIGSSSCTTTCSLGWNNGTGWFAAGNIAPKPYVLAPGRTYYWLVWACNPTECPLSGIKTGSFTVAGSLTEVAPVIISPKGSVSVANGVPSFVWSPASGMTSTSYKVVLKYNSNTFGSGNYWIKDVSPLICWGKTTCTTGLDGTWTWQNGGMTNSPNPPNPLNSGRWYWLVINCKTTTCDLANLSASTIETFTVPFGLSSATNLTQSIGQCKSNGKVDVQFNWTPATNVTSQVIYLSTQNNGFAAGTYITTNLNFGVVNNWNWVDLLSNTAHYWKISSQVNGSWYDSSTATFTTPYCQVSSGLAGDLLRSGTKDDINAYINEVAGNEVDTRSGNSLAYVLQVTMAGESGGGNDCSYHIDYLTSGQHLTLGVFQYDAGTWQSGPNTSTSTNEALNNYDSGSTRAAPPCWKVPGTEAPPELDPAYNTFHNLFGGTNDANIWDPYAQVRETAAYFRAGQQSRWGAYPW